MAEYHKTVQKQISPQNLKEEIQKYFCTKKIFMTIKDILVSHYRNAKKPFSQSFLIIDLITDLKK